MISKSLSKNTMVFKRLHACDFQPSGMLFSKGIPDGQKCIVWACDHMVCLSIPHNAYHMLKHVVCFQPWHNTLGSHHNNGQYMALTVCQQ